MTLKVTANSTSNSIPIFVQDTSSTNGAGLSGLTHSTVGLVAEYRRSNEASWTPITLVAGTLGTYVSGGFVADGSLSGAYEIDPPNAAFASGAAYVLIRLRGAANMLPVLVRVLIDPQWALEATANTAATNAATAVTNTGTLATTLNGVGSNVSAIKLVTDALSPKVSLLDALNAGTGVVLASAQGLYAPAKAGDQMALIDGAITSAKFATDAISALAISAGAAGKIAAAVDVALVNTGDGTDLLQAVANQIAQDWVAGDASPLAIVAALKLDATFIQLVADAAASKTAAQAVNSKVIGTIATGTHNPPLDATATQAAAAAALSAYDPPTKAEMDARSLPSTDYATSVELAKTFKTGETQRHTQVSNNGANEVVVTVAKV